MNILQEDIKKLTFKDISDFCELGYSEGAELDYKQETSPKFWKDLQKYVATFANVRGGLIIIGVKENKKTGIPEIWEGVDIKAEDVDRMDQIIANMSPLPQTITHLVSNDDKTKAFILIRIFKGSNPPYYRVNDTNEWIRTGKVSKAIDIASPQYKRYLFNTKAEGMDLQARVLEEAENIFQSHIFLQEEEEKKKENQAALLISQSQIDLNSSPCRLKINILPIFPNKELISPLQLKKEISSLRFSTTQEVFPPEYWEFQTTLKGITTYASLRSNKSVSLQILSSGLISYTCDIYNEKRDGFPVNLLLRYVHITLMLARNLFEKTGYIGEVSGSVTIENVIGMQAYKHEHYTKQSLLDVYNWPVSTNTRELASPEEYLEYLTNLGKSIYVSFDYTRITEEELTKTFARWEK